MAICSMPKKAAPFLYLGKDEFDYLNSEKNLTKKIFIMADMLSLTQDEHYERQNIVNDILNMLSPYYPECDILVFGSSANGFGFKGCDLDLLFLPFPAYCNMDFKDKGSGVVPSPYYILSGSVPRSKLYSMDEEMHLKFAQRVMFGIKRYFKKVFFIPAKCPILEIEFLFSPIHCDFSASNRLVVYNTQLLWVYGKLDFRVKPLVMFLRCWAKSLGFIAKSLLSSYCLTLLVIFYLQNTEPAVLPSVKYLNEKADCSRIIDGWETAICVDPEYINRHRQRNSKSLSELVMHFFDFFWDFDFVQNIVSVYHGKPLPVKLVKESSDERIRDFNVTPFSVQDPFILSRNVSRNATMKTSFKLSLMIAKNLITHRNFNIQRFLDSTYYQNEIDSLFTVTKQSLSPNSSFLSLQLTYDICNKLSISSQLQPWFDKATQSVLDVLQYGLFLECEVTDKAITDSETEEPPTKKRKYRINDIKDLQRLISIQCIVNFPTLWRRNRTDVLEHLKKKGSNFEVEDSDIKIPDSLKTEYVISKELSTDEIKNITKFPETESGLSYFSFTCDCFKFPDPQLPDIVISFSPLTERKKFNVTKEFLKAFVKKHVVKVIEEV